MQFQKLALIGCGLMGGSFALALREAGCVQHIAGFSASPQTRQRALELQVIDQACDDVAQAVLDADLILLAVPVNATQSSLAAIAPHLAPHALLMDVGSTKCDVVQAARNTLGERLNCFVPAHPIAGKEVAGIEHAESTLYQARRAILTPLVENNPTQIELATQIWQTVGSQVSVMTPESHDATFAAVSHLPHLVAFAAVNAIAQQPNAQELLQMAGPGFRDFSRIAGSEPTVWRDILLANREQVLRQSALLRKALNELETAMLEGDSKLLTELIDTASKTQRQNIFVKVSSELHQQINHVAEGQPDEWMADALKKHIRSESNQRLSELGGSDPHMKITRNTPDSSK